MIPTLLGNLVGGGLFVSTTYWYLYLTGEGSVAISFDTGGVQSAMEAGGPMTRGRGTNHGVDNENMETLVGKDPSSLPNSQSRLKGGLAMELGDDTPYTKTHAERVQSNSSDAKSKADEKV